MSSRVRLSGVAVCGGLGLALAAAAGGCTGLDTLNSSSDWGPGMRFSDTATKYAWAPGSERVTGEGRPRDPHVDSLIREAIEKNLARKGYHMITTGTPDFWIDYRVARDRRGDPNFSGPGIGMMETGSLAVYAFNPATHKLIWRGYIEAKLDESAPPDAVRKLLDTAVKKVMAPIPSREM